VSAPKVSLGQQLEAVRFAETRQRAFANGQAVKPMRGEKVEKFDLERLGAAARTIDWLQKSEAEIKAFLALPSEAREAVLRHGATMAQMCLELAEKEAIAKAGGPVR
jgi:hypothetical protein